MQARRINRRARRGFSLLGMMRVVVSIGILIAVVLVIIVALLVNRTTFGKQLMGLHKLIHGDASVFVAHWKRPVGEDVETGQKAGAGEYVAWTCAWAGHTVK